MRSNVEILRGSAKYPVSFLKWNVRVNNLEEISELGVPVFNAEMRFKAYKVFHRDRVKGKFYFHTALAMRGLALLEELKTRGNERNVEDINRCFHIINDELGREKKLSASFFMPTYYLAPPWENAMTYGLYISLAIRLKRTENIKYALSRIFDTSSSVTIKLGNIDWYEEYPAAKPTLVLNGYLFCVTGLIEAEEYLTSEQKDRVKTSVSRVVNLLENVTAKKGWTYYDINRNVLASDDYHEIHVQQITWLKNSGWLCEDDIETIDRTLNRWISIKTPNLTVAETALLKLKKLIRIGNRIVYAFLHGFK